jgi:hypothetical protein
VKRRGGTKKYNLPRLRVMIITHGTRNSFFHLKTVIYIPFLSVSEAKRPGSFAIGFLLFSWTALVVFCFCFYYYFYLPFLFLSFVPFPCRREISRSFTCDGSLDFYGIIFFCFFLLIALGGCFSFFYFFWVGSLASSIKHVFPVLFFFCFFRLVHLKI